MSISSQLLPGVPLVESPLFDASIESAGLSAYETEVARSLNERGYAVIDFPDTDIHARMDRIMARLNADFGVDLSDPVSNKHPGALRVQDAWKNDPDVKAIAANSKVLALLSKLYGREAFPFQTLNFPVGTEQHPHTDSVHFSSQPERFMCGVWLAFEDTHKDAGPLVYYPGSHKWPIVSNAMIGRRGWQSEAASAQAPFEAVWRAMVDASGLPSEMFFARKGQALIWAANLLHGGSRQNDPTRTRWSQVTHYYFKDCVYYTPAFSEEALGLFDLRTVVNIANGEVELNTILGQQATAPKKSKSRRGGGRGLQRLFQRKQSAAPNKMSDVDDLPYDFEQDNYFRLNPDVAVSGMHAGEHYRLYGRAEGRLYRDS